MDPIGAFLTTSAASDIKSLLVRLLDFLKSNQITALFTCLASPKLLDETDIAISSLIDTWLLLQDFESAGERNRGLYVLKSRGMAHSRQVREFLLTDRGVRLVDVCIGPEGILVGSARGAQEARERSDAASWQEEIDRRRRALELKRQAVEARIAALRSEFSMEEEEELRPPARRSAMRAAPASSRSARRAPAPEQADSRRRLIYVEEQSMTETPPRPPDDAAPAVQTRTLISGTFSLYVAGQTARSMTALANASRRSARSTWQGKNKVEVIDLLANPQLGARGHQILAVPTLVRQLPEPIRKIIGDLSQTDRVLVGLDIGPRH